MTAGAATAEQLYAEDLKVGWTFEGPAQEITLKTFDVFASLTGDAHPIHYDPEFAKHSRFGKPVAHGLLLMAFTALGSTGKPNLQLRDSIVALVRQECRYLNPVFVGDTVWSRFELQSLERRSKGETADATFAVKLVKHPDVLVLEGLHSYYIRYRNP